MKIFLFNANHFDKYEDMLRRMIFLLELGGDGCFTCHDRFNERLYALKNHKIYIGDDMDSVGFDTFNIEIDESDFLGCLKTFMIKMR